MINKTIARRYAQALFDIAKEQKAVEKFAQDLKYAVYTIEENEELKKAIYSRLVPAAAKKELCNKIITGNTHQMVSNFINLVFDKSREEYLVAIVEVFDELVDRENKILKAKVRVADALSEDQLKKLEENLSRMTGQNIKASVDVDPSLIGGITVKIGDIVYDGSVAKQLGMLKEHLQQVQLGR
ncbi:MAG: ATP synthase F1 subunit delta [Bacillota bacterium]|jgi:F-type H+-transporting ATPase subunit delta|nr:ATP synthase F1 subunit delta [Clostridia bacterium]